MYICSLIDFISVFIKTSMNPGKLLRGVNGSVLFAKVTFLLFFRKVNFEVNLEGYNYNVLMKDFVHCIHRRDTP